MSSLRFCGKKTLHLNFLLIVVISFWTAFVNFISLVSSITILSLNFILLFEIIDISEPESISALICMSIATPSVLYVRRIMSVMGSPILISMVSPVPSTGPITTSPIIRLPMAKILRSVITIVAPVVNPVIISSSTPMVISSKITAS